LDGIAELLETDPEPFPGTFEPKYHTFVQQLVATERWPGEQRPVPPFADRVAGFRKANPDSRLGTLLQSIGAVNEAYLARGSGLAFTVKEENWEIFHRKIAEGHRTLLPLLEGERPLPEAFLWAFEIGKGEGWDDDKCLKEAERLAAISPSYLSPHLSLMEKLLVRWGGGPLTGAAHAASLANKIGGEDGDAMYTRLLLRTAYFEDDQMLKNELGIDYDRMRKGCTALQSKADTRSLGLMADLRIAQILQDHDRMRHVARIIQRERTQYAPGAFPARVLAEQLFRAHIDLDSDPDKPEEAAD
jgi:hypothetical protein